MNARGTVLTLALFLLIGAFAVPPRAAAEDTTGRQGGDLRVALQDFGALDARTATTADNRVLELVYDSLGRVDPATLEMVPWAATGWAWDDDLNITVSLRDDLKFSDGTAYDADDVARSFAQYVQSGVTKWKTIVVDPDTLRFDFHRTTVPSVAVQVQDNDQAIVTVSTPRVTAVEGGAGASYTVVLSGRAPTADVTITLTPGLETLVFPETLTFGAGNFSIPQSVTVDAIDDATAEGRHFDAITATAASADSGYNGVTIVGVIVQIQDNDTAGVTVDPSGVVVSEGGPTASYAVSLWMAPTADVTIDLVNVTDVTVMPTTLTFTTSNWNTPQAVTVRAVDDAVAQGTRDDQIDHIVQSADLNYNATAEPIVVAQVLDNDEARVTVSAPTVTAVEGGAGASFTVVLSGRAPTASVTITLTAGIGTTVSPGTLTFTTSNWNTPQGVTVNAVDDAIIEWWQTVAITAVATSTDVGYNTVAVPSVTVLVGDNDEAGVTVSPTTLTVAEGGLAAPYTVVLWRQPTANTVVVVNLVAGAGTTVTPSSLTFNGADWNTPQSVSVRAVDDALAQGGRTAQITGTTVSLDPDYDAVSPNRLGPGLFFTQGLSAFLAWDVGATPKYSGPYAVQSSTAGQLVLEPNENHFAGRPNLDTITFLWPYTVALDATGNTTSNDAGCALMFREVDLIGWNLLSNDLTNTRDCADWGGFPAGRREAIQSIDPNRTALHIQTAKNPGSDLLYFGFTFNTNSIFLGAPGTEAQRLRSAIYWFVNKANHANIEGAGSTRTTHSPIPAKNAPWAPLSCGPWTPCDTVVDAGFTGAGTTTGTNTGPGRLALTLGGFLDRNADGVRELSTGAPVAFRMIAPDFGVDPRKSTIADDVSGLLVGAGGLSVTVEKYNTVAAWDQAIADCKTSGSCMYVKRFTGATQLPDWLYSMPEVAAADDPLVDQDLAAGAAECFEVSCRQTYVGQVTHLLGSAADLLPVLHFEALDAYDFMAFEGWVNMFGGVTNFWTYTGLRLPALGSLNARLAIAPTTTVRPGETTQVLVNVEDELGQPVPDAAVVLTLPPGGGSVTALTGTTDGVGVFRTTYSPPTVVAERTDVWIGVSVTKSQYTGATAAAVLTVHPAAAGLLGITMIRADLDGDGQPDTTIDSGNTTQITVRVRDALGTDVTGAVVTLRTNLPGATITPTSGTTGAGGLFQASFTADVKQGVQYQIFADVSAPGFKPGTQSTSLVVRSDFTEPVRQIDVTRNVPGFEAAYALGAVAVVFALVALGRRRRED